jgi:hypothetical protein
MYIGRNLHVYVHRPAELPVHDRTNTLVGDSLATKFFV